MKKFLTVCASSLLAVTMFSFAGCGSKGVVSGNYTTPTEAELETALDGVDETKIMNELKGLELGSSFEINVTADQSKLAGTFDLGYKLSLDEGISGAGTVSLKYSLNDNGEQSSENYKAEIYNDTKNIYAEVTGLPDMPGFVTDGTLKGKLEFAKLFDIISSQLPISYAVSESSVNIADMLEMLDEYKVNIGLDNSNGLKLKLGFTEDSIWAFADNDSLKQAVTFNSFIFDVYFALDKEGAFSQLSADVNIDCTVDGTKINNAQFGSVSLKIKGYAFAKTYSGSVSLPNGIASDSTYTDYTMLLFALGGNLPF